MHSIPPHLACRFPLLRSYQSISPCLRILTIFRNRVHFYGDELLELPSTSKLEDHPLSEVRDCFFSIFTATLHIGGRSSIRNLRTRHAVMTGAHLSRPSWELRRRKNLTSAWNWTSIPRCSSPYSSDCNDRNIPAFTQNSKEGINSLTLKYRPFITRAALHTSAN